MRLDRPPGQFIVKRPVRIVVDGIILPRNAVVIAARCVARRTVLRHGAYSKRTIQKICGPEERGRRDRLVLSRDRSAVAHPGKRMRKARKPSSRDCSVCTCPSAYSTLYPTLPPVAEY